MPKEQKSCECPKCKRIFNLSSVPYFHTLNCNPPVNMPENALYTKEQVNAILSHIYSLIMDGDLRRTIRDYQDKVLNNNL